MRVKIILLAAIGLVLILGAAAGTWNQIYQSDQRVAQVQAALDSYGERVSIPVASRDLAEGAIATASDFTSRELPARFFPEGMLRSLPPLDVTQTGYMILGPVRAGRLLAPADIAVTSDQIDKILLTADAGAVSVSVENLEDIRPHLSPGTRVDLFWARPLAASQEIRLLASGVRVLALPAQGQMAQPTNGALLLPDVAPSPSGRVPAPPNVAGSSAEPDPEPSDSSPVASAARLLLEAPPRSRALILMARSEGTLYVALSGPERRLENGDVVVNDLQLRALPLAVRETSRPAPQLRAAPQPASLPPSEPQTCSLAMVKAASRTLIQVPCQ